MNSKKQILEQLAHIDNLMEIYSSIDMIRVDQLAMNKRNLETVLLSLMAYENNIHMVMLKALNG